DDQNRHKGERGEDSRTRHPVPLGMRARKRIPATVTTSSQAVTKMNVAFRAIRANASDDHEEVAERMAQSALDGEHDRVAAKIAVAAWPGAVGEAGEAGVLDDDEFVVQRENDPTFVEQQDPAR